jgi:acyl carrier protein
VRDGELFVTGRLKDLIIVRGRNHYAHDIEFSVKDSHPALREEGGVACSVEIDGEERLVIVHEIDRHRHAESDAAMAAIRAAVVAAHEVTPFAVVLVRQSTVPRTSSGKKQRTACGRAFLDGALAVVAEWREGASAAPELAPAPGAESQPRSREEIEAFLVMRVAANLAVSPDALDLSEPFSAFGLDSLRAVALMGEVEAWLGRSLSPTLLYNFPTIPALAAHLAETAAEPLDLERLPR